jgi:Tfp pilus assembly protein FimT
MAATLLAISLSLWSGGIRERRVVRAAEDIAGILRFAHQAAMADAADACAYRVVIQSIQAEARRVARDQISGTCTSPEVVTTVRLTEAFPRGVTVPPTTVQFTTAGQLASSLTGSIVVSSGDRVRHVHVETATGIVEVRTTP